MAREEKFALPDLELSGSNFAGQVLADAQGVAVEFVDYEEGPPFVEAVGADDVYGLWDLGWDRSWWCLCQWGIADGDSVPPRRRASSS